MVRIPSHPWKEQREGVSQVGIYRKWHFSHQCGIAESPTANGKCPGHLKMISDHLSCQIKLGKAMQGKPGKTWEHRSAEVRRAGSPQGLQGPCRAQQAESNPRMCREGGCSPCSSLISDGSHQNIQYLTPSEAHCQYMR